MSTRYENAPKFVERTVEQMIKLKFPVLRKFNTKVVIDAKGMKSKGRRVFGKMKLADEFEKFLSRKKETDFQGYDFIMILDKKLVETQPKSDTKRVVFHELSHGGVNDSGKPIILNHDFEGFYAELDYNEDDPKWAERITTQLAQEYGEE